MKRWLSHLTIASYLLFLAAGIVCHTVNWGTGAHPAMYYVVWDMFCGWSAYEVRYHLIGEGESGAYYDLSHGPWGEFRPYGDVGRQHYDPNGSFSFRLAYNVLDHTDHEPMSRIFVVEESWPKKFNIPDHLWEQRYEQPKDPLSYYHVRHVATADGVLLSTREGWLAFQYGVALASNPRLRADARKNQPFISVNGLLSLQQLTPGIAQADRQVGSPLGN